jgi:Zn-dependent protease with chaperone function
MNSLVMIDQWAPWWSRSAIALLMPIGVLILPVVLTLCFRRMALHQMTEAHRRSVWASYRQHTRFILAITVAIWWVVWDLQGREGMIALGELHLLKSNESSSSEALLFWVPPVVSLGMFLLLCRAVDKVLLRLKWKFTQSVQQVWWTLVSFVIPLLMVTAGFSRILDRKVRGIAWLIAAGALSRLGTAFLRRSKGMKFNRLKSGEIRNQALSVASAMGVTIDRVYVVPAGKEHLVNGYGMSNAIGLTDNLGKYLTKPQKDYVIAHELAHVKLKHPRKHLLLVMTTFCVASVLLFSLPEKARSFRPFIQVIAILGPLAAVYCGSRRFEYSADKEAVELTGDSETAIQALANLERSRELPATQSRLMEWFMTHPTFENRVEAIAKFGSVPADHLRAILEEAGTSKSAAATLGKPVVILKH